MLRVLHVLGTLDMGGIENFLMNVYRNIDRNKIQFDFVINDRGKEDIFEKEIINLGGKIYKIPPIIKVGHFRYFKVLREIFQKNNYNIVHSHYNMVSGFILKEAKKCGIKVRISHSHSTYDNSLNSIGLKNIYKRYSRYLIARYATHKFACSEEAGKWLFKGKNFEIIKNGIDISKFSFNNKIREKIREKFGISKNTYTIVNIGRMNISKNHFFMIEIMKKLEKIDKNIKLYLIGDGELKEKIEEKIKEYNLKNIILLGVQKNVNEILNGMDLMLFPSSYEGLGIVAIEAQVNGLNVLASERVPKDADIGLKLFKTLNLDNDITKWIEEIIKYKNNLNRKQTEEEIESLLNSNYNIKKVIKNLENKYYNLLESKSE